MLEKYEVQAGNAVLAEAKHLPVYQDLVENHQPVTITITITLTLTLTLKP